MTPRGPEAPRDQEPSGFTPILRALWEAEPAILCAVVVDYEGECIDYCASIDPFEAKIHGAALLPVLVELRERTHRVGAGALRAISVHTDEKDLVARPIGSDCALVVVLGPDTVGVHALESIERAVHALHLEAGLPAPHAEDLVVEIRKATGWEYAPSRVHANGACTEIAAVLGRWTEVERKLAREVVCFRVRTASGEELTLAHDERASRWEIR